MDSGTGIGPSQQSPPRKQRRIADRDRKRAARACDSCHRQKERCEGGVPCRRCVRLRRACEFASTAIRDVPPGPVAHQQQAPQRAESILSSCNDASELALRIEYMEKLLTHYTGTIDFDNDTLKGLADELEIEPQLRSRPRHGASPASDCPGVDEERFTVQPLDNNMTHYSGEFSHWNFSMRIKRWLEESESTGRPAAETGFKEYYRAEELQPSSISLHSLSSLPPRYIADFLIHIFFKHAETNYWYMDKTWLQSKVSFVYEDAVSLTRRDVGIVCVIFMVLAIGTQYAYLESSASRYPAHDGAEAVENGGFSEDAIGVMFYQQACQLIPEVVTIASLESVQACLLVGLYTLPLDASGLSYIYLNLALKLAIQNGMHRKDPGNAWDAATRETRNRVWWTIYTTERRVGIFHGRPLSIPAADVDAELPQEMPDMESSSSHTARIRATVQLHQRLASIAQEISNLRTLSKQEMAETLNRLVDHKQRLAKWWQDLPDVFWKEDDTRRAASRSDLHLKIEYCLVRMFAGRPFIFPLRDYSARSTASSSGSPAEQAERSSHSSSSGSKPPHTRALLVQDCVEAALTIVDTCQLIHHTVGLARASYTEFSGCRAALLVIITQCLQANTDRLRQSLRVGMKMMKIMSAGGESAKSEMSLIEAFERAISRLEAAEQSAAANSNNNNTQETDYAKFKKWEMLWKNDSPGQAQMPVPPGSSHAAAAAAAVGLLPMPPFLPPDQNNLWRGAVGVEQQHQASLAPAPARATPTTTTTPFFSLDSNFASFPQTLDELSSMFSYGFSPGPPSNNNNNNNNAENTDSSSTGRNVWMPP